MNLRNLFGLSRPAPDHGYIHSIGCHIKTDTDALKNDFAVLTGDHKDFNDEDGCNRMFLGHIFSYTTCQLLGQAINNHSERSVRLVSNYLTITAPTLTDIYIIQTDLIRKIKDILDYAI